MQIKVKKLSEDAQLPVVSEAGAACWDLFALEDTEFKPGEIKLVRTGLVVVPPDGWRFNLYARSSTPFKKRFILANSVGIIDSNYRGECFVQLMNINITWMDTNPDDVALWENKIQKGDRIAQLELVKDTRAIDFPIEVIDEVDKTSRGSSGIGSTGN